MSVESDSKKSLAEKPKTIVVPDHALLPHEGEMVGRINEEYFDHLPFNPDRKGISIKDIAPYIGATVLNYPSSTELRVLPGSRVIIRDEIDEMVYDIVGFHRLYREGIIDEIGREVTPISVDSPLAKVVLGATNEQELEMTVPGSSKTSKISVLGIDQLSIRQLGSGNLVDLQIVD